MKHLLNLLLLLAVLWLGKELYNFWLRVKAKADAQDRGQAAEVQKPAESAVMAGLPPSMEPSLQEAMKQGAPALEAWLKQNGNYVADPRRASIELDYAVLIGSKDFARARQIYSDVRGRTPTNSPVYPRVRQLERTFR
jgi:hypothetical protein